MNFKKIFLAISIVAARVPWSGDFDPTFMSAAPEKLRVLYGKMSIHRQQEFWLRRVSFEKVKDPRRISLLFRWRYAQSSKIKLV